MCFVDKFLSSLVQTLYACYNPEANALNNFSGFLREMIDTFPAWAKP